MSGRLSRGLAAACLATLIGAAAHSEAPAAVPAAGGQAAGFYRLFIGRFEVTALLDGTHAFPSDKVALGASTAAVTRLLADGFLPLRYEGMINAFLINMDGRLVLIDTGAGDLYGTEGGGLGVAIRAAGYRPEDVRDVFITHLHEDHAGGLVRDGKPVFPSAIVHVARREAAFWLDSTNQMGVDPLLKPFFPAVQGVVQPYKATGRLQLFDGTASLLPGLKPLAAPGHTPGHTAYLLQDRGSSLLFWGDTVHMAPVQFPRPEIAIRYDWNVPLAIAARRRLLALAADRKWLVAGAHISFPGIGHVRRAGLDRFEWVPANYTLNRGRP